MAVITELDSNSSGIIVRFRMVLFRSIIGDFSGKMLGGRSECGIGVSL